MIRTLFIGTSEFAVPIINAVAHNNLIDLKAVITQPDRPVGRHHSKLQMSPIKLAYNKLVKDIEGIKLYQPERISTISSRILDEVKPELIVVASYGQMLPKILINYPKYRALNVHGSLLPLLRGAVPIPMAILQGLSYTGVTIQLMVDKMDEGDILATDDISIMEDDTTESMTDKLSQLAANLFNKIISDWIHNKLYVIKQGNTDATYCYKKDLVKANAQINWAKSAIEIDRMVRAYNPWPVAWTVLGLSQEKDAKHLVSPAQFCNKKLKIFKVRILNIDDLICDTAKLYKYQKKLVVKCGSGWLEILECQLEGKRKLKADEYLYLASDKITE